ncbi:hypothetical protein PHYPSEUDO_004552 [Phytophthora pseudosyringae]|uniref:Uncharacterized protein n=1 Tax=Phytophthora pseudosyringae TaxID=221518 RepID=A0A8T1WBQ3_9STRA|nr:hypothetical protein PHYPSEUDO_004552 [Phytophthora pseudosyringae]
MTRSETEAPRESDAGLSDADDDGPANKNWDQGDEEDDEEGEEQRGRRNPSRVCGKLPEDWCVLPLKQPWASSDGTTASSSSSKRGEFREIANDPGRRTHSVISI